MQNNLIFPQLGFFVAICEHCAGRSLFDGIVVPRIFLALRIMIFEAHTDNQSFKAPTAEIIIETILFVVKILLVL